MILKLTALRVKVTTALLYVTGGVCNFGELTEALEALEAALVDYPDRVAEQVILDVEREVREAHDEAWEAVNGEVTGSNFEIFSDFNELLDTTLEREK